MTQLRELADEKLVSLYSSGNNEAFDVLLARYKDKLYSYILFAVHNADVADDIFQETFVRAIMTIRQGRYREDGKFYDSTYQEVQNEPESDEIKGFKPS